MIIKDKDALARLHSPDNLLNRLSSASRGTSSRKGAMDLFGVASRNNTLMTNVIQADEPTISETNQELVPPSAPARESPQVPTIDNLLENADTKIKLAQVHDLALTTLHSAITTMSIKLDDVKPEKLPAVIAAMGKTVNDIRREQNEAVRNKDGNRVNIIFYTPEQRKLTDYAVIDV